MVPVFIALGARTDKIDGEKSSHRIPVTARRTLIAIIAFAGLMCPAFAQTTSTTASKWQAPPDAAGVPNPEAKNPAAPAVGRKRFLRNCVNCHGEDGSGHDASGADLRAPEVQEQSDGALFWKITNGNTTNGMPSFAALPETDRWDIVTFLRTLKDSNGNSSGGSRPRKAEAPNFDKQN
jgi:mono/diheme cytochrome c family protein